MAAGNGAVARMMKLLESQAHKKPCGFQGFAIGKTQRPHAFGMGKTACGGVLSTAARLTAGADGINMTIEWGNSLMGAYRNKLRGLKTTTRTAGGFPLSGIVFCPRPELKKANLAWGVGDLTASNPNIF